MPIAFAEFDLGRWMLAASGFGALLAVGALAVERLQRLGARATRGAWALALGMAVVWPFAAALWLTPPVLVAEVGGVAVMGAATAVVPVAPMPTLAERVSGWWSVHGGPMLPMLWLAASVTLGVQLVIALRRLRRAAGAAQTMELHGESVLVSESLGPAVFGVWRPRVVVPRWVLELDTPLQALVLRHEREHCEGRDGWLVWLAVLSTTLVPWNLAVWYLAHRLRLAMEVDCDARTLRAFPDRRTAYARLLLFIAQRATPVRVAPALAHWPSHLSRRIAAMTTDSFTRPTLQRAVAGVVLVAASVGACSRTVAGNLAGPAPVPVNAPAKPPAAAPDSLTYRMPIARPDSTVARTMPTGGRVANSTLPYFDFQVEKPAMMKTGSVGPKYPAAQRAAGVKGVVLAQYVVGTDGRVDMATFKVLKSDHDDFTTAVRDALANVTYEPAMVNGAAVKQLVQQPFVFDLAGSNAPAPAVPTGPEIAAAPAAPETPWNHMARPTGRLIVPTVPAALRASTDDIVARVQVVIGADGKADMGSFRVERSGDARWTQAVRDFLGTATWDPAVRDGRAVRQLLTIEYSTKASLRYEQRR